MIFISCMLILMIFTHYHGWGIVGDERKGCDVGDDGPKRWWTEIRCYSIFLCRVLNDSFLPQKCLINTRRSM